MLNYTLLKADDHHLLIKKVKWSIGQGWSLLGAPIAVAPSKPYQGDNGPVFVRWFQAMTREESNDGSQR